MSNVNKVKKVSKVKIAKACPYLKRTGEWFQKKFGKHLSEKKWEDVAFVELVEHELNFIFRVGNKLLEEEVVDKKDVVKCAGELYKILVSQDKQGNTEQGVFKFAPLEKQFAFTYKGNVHEELMKKINLCHNLWVIGKGIRWHSPYLSIVQSSGFGKSRACKEIATSIVDEKWLTFYICCRDSEWIGYPPQTQPAVEFFKKLLTASPEEAQRVIGNWIKWLIYFRFVFWLVFVHSSMDIEAIVNDVTSMEMDCLLQKWKIDSFTDVQYDREKEEKERMAFWSLCFECSHDKLMKRMFNFINSLAENGKMPEKIQKMLKCKHVLLVIDEARFLSSAAFSSHSNVTLFRAFCAALKDFRSGFFAVVVDTLSRIANFAPSRKLDPSLRYIEKDDRMDKDLFHPFTAVTTTDVLCHPNRNLDEAKYRFTLGRPLWKITLDYCIVNEISVTTALDELISFALKKLFGGVCMPNHEGKIACIAVLTGINISPLSTIANELVASHMATCLAINANRESLLMMYPVEPVLAEAAKFYIKQEYGHRQLSKVFEPLQDCFRIGAIDRGHNGKLVAKLLILLGLFQISEVGSVVSSCQCVLDALFGKDIMKNESLAHAGDEFSFNCFTELVRNSKYWVESDAQHELALYFNRGAAIQLPRGHPGADLLLPIRRKIICEKSGCDQYHYKYLLIQVKNYKGNLVQSQVKGISWTLERSFVEGTSWADCNIGWSVIMNVGQEKEEAYWYSKPATQNNVSLPTHDNAIPSIQHNAIPSTQEYTIPATNDSTSVPTQCDGNPNALQQNVSMAISKYLVVKGIGPSSYPVLKDQSLLVNVLQNMLREPMYDDWTIDQVDEFSKIVQRGKIQNLCPVTLPSSANKKETKSQRKA